MMAFVSFYRGPLMLNVSADIAAVFKKALEMINHSHSPYSQLKVVAALKLKKPKDTVVFGVNVENASFGATFCAERSAIVAAQSQLGGPLEAQYLMVLSSREGEPIPPCGLCLQVIQEFFPPELPIYLGGFNGLMQSWFFKDLLPRAFAADQLPNNS